MDVNTYVPALRTTLGKELLKPTRIYVRAFAALKEKVSVKGMAHITGGGIPGNLLRILPRGVRARIDEGSWSAPPIFELIRDTGNIADSEMKSTFNMGIGYIVVLPKNQGEKAVALLKKEGYSAFIIGNTEKGGKGVHYS
jgi:phosphoribosylformylglycinamidine cyclo-ligase